MNAPVLLSQPTLLNPLREGDHMPIDLWSEPTTHHHTPNPIPLEQAPYLIGCARRVAAEVRIGAESIERISTGYPRELAHQLATHATRLGQAASALSGVQLADVAILYIGKRLSRPQKIAAILRLSWRIWTA